MSQQQHQPQKLSLRNPSTYHILASQENHAFNGISNFNLTQESEQVEFSDSFSHPLAMPRPREERNDYTHIFYNRDLAMNNVVPMDIHHRRSSANEFGQQVIFPGSLESDSSLAMSAPASMDYHYGYPPFSAQSGEMARSFEDDYTAQMNLQLMMEKRRRRRESHNAVERRRRDTINDRIQELCNLLPESSLETMTLGPNNKPNKGAILKKSVEHIRELQQEVQNYQQQMKELEKTLAVYRQK
ncbi:HLH-domain-containing protein [Backusella circina FSU 941]|nr:HLH-domain-containing protein [Backusella circina FSU 941]